MLDIPPSLLAKPNPANDLAAQKAAKLERIKSAPRRIAEQLVMQWQASFDALWADDPAYPLPEKIADLGTDAAELFALNSALTDFVLSQVEGKRDDLANMISARVASLPPVSFDAEGRAVLPKKAAAKK